MKLFAPLTFLTVTILSTFAAPRAQEVGDIPVLSEYAELFSFCEAGGPDAYVGVQYADGFLTTFAYGQCYPYSVPDHGLAAMAVFCKSVTCENNPNPDCTGGAVPPVPVPIVAGLTLINAADFVQILGQGATCQPNDLPL
ncbi:hypothetical protein CPB84DRAFT_1828519 [Gymnopilus junonius]|uniref:Uncharacterized protein n=1 Tax=Gymnopilus junonius TaxID=109634 RepID=A0A9P5NEJ6_GYMJU|nr:hypothetical protein CPB84DRAFT_1828519 [Gymnopilus junonius]